MKEALNTDNGWVKRMVMGPPSSEATLLPERGGNSNSLRLIPAVRTIVLKNVKPENWLLTAVLSVKASKLIVDAGCEPILFRLAA